MSAITEAAEQGWKLAVNVKSVLEEALDKMPDNEMPGEQVLNGLKKRGVQDIEIKQSGAEKVLTPKNKINPKELKEVIKGTRQDKYNVHEIKGEPRINSYDTEDDIYFPEKAYRGVALVDTDDNSYAVRIYNNSTVNRKGIDSRFTHWSDVDEAKDYVFHTRTDSPQSGVHRIQEIQSDVQNMMTKAKNELIERFQIDGIPKSDLHLDDYILDVPYIKQGLQEEIIHAINNGQKEVWLTNEPELVTELSRAVSVQEAYGTGGAINNTFRKLAKRFDAVIKEEDGYLKMLLPTEKPNNPAKYAGGIAGVSLTVPAYAEPHNNDFRHNAYAQGYTPMEVNEYIKENSIPEDEQPLWYAEAKNQGYTEEEITQYEFEQFIKNLPDEALANAPEIISDNADEIPQVDIDGNVIIAEPTYTSLPRETIEELSIELGVNPVSPTGMDQVYEAYLQRNDPALYNKAYGKSQTELENTMADITELYDVDRPFMWLKSKLGFAEGSATYKQARARDRQNVVETAKSLGLDIVYGTGPEDVGGNGLETDVPFVRIERQDGSIDHQVAEPGFMATMMRHFGEATLGIAGAAEGVKKAQQIGAAIDPTLVTFPGGRMASMAVKFSVISAYTAAGTMLGDQIDYASAAIRQDQDMEWAVAAEKMMGAAQVSVVADALAVPVAAVGKFAWGKFMNAWREVTDGNLDAAYEVLKDVTGLDEGQITEIVQRWKNLNTPNNSNAPITIEQKSAIPFTGGTKQRVLNEKEEALAVIPTTSAGGESLVAAAANLDQQASLITARQVNKRAQDLIEETSNRFANATNDLDLVEASQKALNDYVSAEKTLYDQTRTIGNDIVHSYNPNYNFKLETTALKPLLDTIESTIGKVGKAEQAVRTIEQIMDRNKSGTFDDLIDMRQLMNELFGNARGGLKKKHIEAFKEVMGQIDNEIDSVMKITPGGDTWLSDWSSARESYGRMKDLTSNVLARAITREGTNPDTLANAFIRYGKASDGTYSDLMKQLDHKLWNQVELSIVDKLVNKRAFGMEGEFRAIQFPELDKDLKIYDFLTKDAQELQQAVARLSEVYTNDASLSYISGGIKLAAPQQALTTDLTAKAKYQAASKVWNYVNRYFGTSDANMASTVHKVAEFLESPLDSATVKEAIQVAQKDNELLRAIEEVQKQAAAQQAKQSGTMKAKIFVNKQGHRRWEPAKGYTWKDDTIPAHRITTEEVLKEKLQMDPANLSEVDKRLLKSRGFKAIGLTDGTLVVLD